MMYCCLNCDVVVCASSELMVSSHGFMIDDDDDDDDYDSDSDDDENDDSDDNDDVWCL